MSQAGGRVSTADNEPGIPEHNRIDKERGGGPTEATTRVDEEPKSGAQKAHGDEPGEKEAIGLEKEPDPETAQKEAIGLEKEPGPEKARKELKKN